MRIKFSPQPYSLEKLRILLGEFSIELLKILASRVISERKLNDIMSIENVAERKLKFIDAILNNLEETHRQILFYGYRDCIRPSSFLVEITNYKPFILSGEIFDAIQRLVGIRNYGDKKISIYMIEIFDKNFRRLVLDDLKVEKLDLVRDLLFAKIFFKYLHGIEDIGDREAEIYRPGIIVLRHEPFLEIRCSDRNII